MPEVVGNATKERFFASWLDHLIALALTLSGVVLVPAEYPALKWAPLLGIYPVYFILGEALWSRTPGKFVFGLVIRRLDGRSCGWKESLIRFALRLIELNPALCGALPAGIAILTTRRRQRLGDLLANTVVVSSKLRWDAAASQDTLDIPRAASQSKEQAMPMENSHIWLGQFLPGSPDDFFEEQYGRDDGEPLSQFAGSQGETWYDHDWIEISFLDDLESVRSLVEGHSYSETYLDAVVAQAATLGIEQANVFILADKEQFAAPRSVNGPNYRLWYLGEFRCGTK